MKKHILLLLATFFILTLLFVTPARPPAAAEGTTLFLPYFSNHYPLEIASGNLLPNPSFEEGWYHPQGIPELQVPLQWQFSWEEGPNPFDDAPWSDWVRPEVRVLPKSLLPPEEHDLFIWEGEHTVKIFKGYGAISYELVTELWLAPGTYLLEVSIFPDLVDHYENGEKVFAPDPLSGEFRFLIGDDAYAWWLPIFGKKNTLWKLFTVDEGGVVTLGVGIRGRWALQNNGWFMDDWRLVEVGASE